MNEGCNADIAYLSSPDNKEAMGIQIKITGKVRQYGRGFYSFAMSENEYPGKLMIFHSLLEGLAWVIPYEVVIQYYQKVTLKIRQSNEPGK